MKTQEMVGLEKTLKETVGEAIEDKKSFFYQTFLEVLEDVGLSKAIEDGLKTGKTSKQEIMEILHAD